MQTNKIKELISLFLKRPSKETGEGWVMCSCPFATWTHTGGDDSRYSFGISTSGGYNCFTCGKHGSILSLPKEIARYWHINPLPMEEFIKEHIGNYTETTSEIRLTEIPAEVIEVYPYAPSILHLTPQDVIKWNIRYDESNSCLFFPVYHEGKIIAIKVRKLPKVFYFLGSNTNFKRAGIWYGEQFKKTDAIFLVEGERDAILLGRYVTVWASLGEPTTAQLSTIRKLNRKVVLFFDNDETGKRIRQKAKRQLLNFLPLYYVSNYCGCKDPAEIVEKGKIKQALKSIKKEVL